MPKNNLSLLLVRAFVIAALVACGTVVQAAEQPQAKKDIASAPAAVTQGVVARVNGTAIDAIELKRAKKMLLRGQTVPEEQQAEVDKQVLNQLVTAEILYQLGLKLEIKEIDKQVEERLAQYKKQFATEKDFTKSLKDLEVDDKGLRDYMRRNVIINAFVEKTIVPKVSVSEEETRKLFEEAKSRIKRQKVEAAVQAFVADAVKSAKIEIISNK